jgi:hypothetical protein
MSATRLLLGYGSAGYSQYVNINVNLLLISVYSTGKAAVIEGVPTICHRR